MNGRVSHGEMKSVANDHAVDESLRHRVTRLSLYGISALFPTIMARRRSETAAEQEKCVQKALAALSRGEFPTFIPGRNHSDFLSFEMSAERSPCEES
jgi:hypothetical protein